MRGTGCGCRVFAHLRVRVWGVFGFLGAGKRCAGVVRFVWFGMLLGFEATSLRACGLGAGRVLRFVWGFGWCVSCGWRGSWCFGVCPVFAAGALVWWRFCAVARVCLRGCGVVVWELYSEREHLADEMSLGVLFLGFLGV